MQTKKDYILETIAEILDVDRSILKEQLKPYEVLEWDSLANMNIFVSLNDHPEIELDFQQYLNCKNIKELINIIDKRNS